MKIKKKINGLYIIKNKKYIDRRGYFKEIYRENKINKRFPFLVMSYSKKNVLRGLHIQTKNMQGKFITVLKGKIFDVVVDLRKKSKTFGKYFTTVIGENNSKSLYIPAGFAHGFLTLENENFVIYSCTKYRDAYSEIGIKYNDLTLNINWPSKKIILSNKDKKNLSLKEFKDKYIK